VDERLTGGDVDDQVIHGVNLAKVPLTDLFEIRDRLKKELVRGTMQHRVFANRTRRDNCESVAEESIAGEEPAVGHSFFVVRWLRRLGLLRSVKPCA